MKREHIEKKYKWDFSNIYKNIDEWKNDLTKAEVLVNKIAELKNKLKKRNFFYYYLKLEKEKNLLIVKLSHYLHLLDIDQTNFEFQELNSIMENFEQISNIRTSFISNELKSIGEKIISNWILNSEYKEFAYFFRHFFKESKYVLSESEEELINKISRSRSAVGNLYDSLAYADNEIEKIELNKEIKELNNLVYKKIMEDSDPILEQNLRQNAEKLYFSNFTKRKHSFSKIYEAILQKQIENKNIRKYNNILEMALFNDEVNSNIYLKLIEIGKKYINEFKKYNLLIKEKYNLKTFNSTDRKLKLVQNYDKDFSVEEAIKISKEALKPLGEIYISKLNIALKENLIDFYESQNKVQGAYSSGGNGIEPIILMNWDFKLSSVNTLLHELGHSVHTIFSDEYQKYPLNNYPIILAEVASTLNEHFLFDYMYNQANEKNEKIYLLQQRIFDLNSTFYRQIQFADFEYSAHKLVENSEPITTKTLMELFKTKQIEFGYDIFDDNQLDVYNWSYISHFFHSPFYVYKYAIDLVASFKLYSDFKNGNNNILNFLKSGGSKEPLDILKDVGVDFEKEETYLPLVNEISYLIEELKKLI
ncbi:oligoendopeptidase F [Spiroplasma taiwanense]|uniref:Oligopeptidase F n=1 Tax=Spiroplasma taiwanense CT-1 TaxID=1276220 RepID=S5MD44_9MOLU|nr:oligoendopeptidase F [Spiroplasma taiwanense]AGR41628.1 oligoendopeptidase F [Spiroplasma taiwanense CT-1]